MHIFGARFCTQLTKNTLFFRFILVDNQSSNPKEDEMKTTLVKTLVTLLLIIGGLTVGLTQLFDFNPVEKVFGTDTTVTGVVYILVGVSALLTLYTFITDTMHHKTT